MAHDSRSGGTCQSRGKVEGDGPLNPPILVDFRVGGIAESGGARLAAQLSSSPSATNEPPSLLGEGRRRGGGEGLLRLRIVPLENRIDYLKLNTGKTFSIPFEELVIFSTNIEPEDLMDPAFLRRLPYKIEVGAPSVDSFRRIFQTECGKVGLTVSTDEIDAIIYRIEIEKGLELAAYQPKFIVDQVVATCRFMEQVPQMEPRYVDYALANLRVQRGATQKQAPQPEPEPQHA